MTSVTSEVSDQHWSLTDEAQPLYGNLFQALIAAVKGSSLLLFTLNGESARYIYGIIFLGKYAELGAGNHRVAAMPSL